MTLVSKKVYIDKLDDIVNKYNHRTIKIKPVDVKRSIYIDFENNEVVPKFEVGDNVRISKYKNIFAKDYVPNWSEEFLWLKKLKILFRGHMLLLIFGEEIVETFYIKEFQKINQKELRVEKVIKRICDKPYVKWYRGYDSSLNSWIDQKDII